MALAELLHSKTYPVDFPLPLHTPSCVIGDGEPHDDVSPAHSVLTVHVEFEITINDAVIISTWLALYFLAA